MIKTPAVPTDTAAKARELAAEARRIATATASAAVLAQMFGYAEAEV